MCVYICVCVCIMPCLELILHHIWFHIRSCILPRYLHVFIAPCRAILRRLPMPPVPRTAHWTARKCAAWIGHTRLAWQRKSLGYPLANIPKTMETSTFFDGQTMEHHYQRASLKNTEGSHGARQKMVIGNPRQISCFEKIHVSQNFTSLASFGKCVSLGIIIHVCFQSVVSRSIDISGLENSRCSKMSWIIQYPLMIKHSYWKWPFMIYSGFSH